MRVCGPKGRETLLCLDRFRSVRLGAAIRNMAVVSLPCGTSRRRHRLVTGAFCWPMSGQDFRETPDLSDWSMPWGFRSRAGFDEHRRTTCRAVQTGGFPETERFSGQDQDLSRWHAEKRKTLHADEVALCHGAVPCQIPESGRCSPVLSVVGNRGR